MAPLASEGSGYLAHPYYPPGLAIPNYAPNTMSLVTIFQYFLGALGAYLISGYVMAGLVRQQFSSARFSDKALFLWFFMCYFVLNHATLAGSQSVRAQLWKEYALSDSRYLTSDPFMLCVEGLTVVVHGSLCYLTAVTIVKDAGSPTGNSGVRHVLQMLVSTLHLFGVLLYYGTLLFQESLQGTSHCRPEFLYRWVYFVGMNAPWVVVPLYIICSSASEICRAFSTTNGNIKVASPVRIIKRERTPF